MSDTFLLTRPGQPVLRCGLWRAGKSRPAVLLTPGFGEHIGRYEHVARRWCDAGLTVGVYDPRGQGRSSGRRGHVHRFVDFLEDLLAVQARLVEMDPGFRQPMLFGHSMGALISTHAVLAHPARFRALALASPFFGLAIQAAPWRIWLGRNLSSWWPTFSNRASVAPNALTHDRECRREIAADPLGVHRVTARWFTEMEAAQERVQAQWASLNLPVFCYAAGDDQVADVSQTERLFVHFPAADRNLRLAPGQYHELHHEVGWEGFMDAFAEQFLAWHAAPLKSAPPPKSATRA